MALHSLLPGWLTKRAREMEATGVVTILAPAAPNAAGIYLLFIDEIVEFHAVDDAESGIDGVTIPMSRREAGKMLGNLAGALSGRLAGETLPPLGGS